MTSAIVENERSPLAEARDAERPQTSVQWGATIGELGIQIAGVQSEAAEIDAGRGPLALRAQLGDTDARALLDAQFAKLEALDRQQRDLQRAAAEARNEFAAAEQREAAARQA